MMRQSVVNLLAVVSVLSALLLVCPSSCQTSTSQEPTSKRPRPTLALQVGHSDEITCLAFSPDGNTLATGSGDNTARLWDTLTYEVKAILRGHIGEVSTVAFSPQGSLLATGSSDDTVRLWEAHSGQLETVLTGHIGTVEALAFSPDGKVLATGHPTYKEVKKGHFVECGEVRLWDVASGQRKSILRGHDGRVSTLAFSRDGRTLASGSYDSTVKLWDVAGWHLTATLKGHSGPTTTVVFSPDNKILASGSSDKTARLWDVGAGQLKATLKCHTEDFLEELAFSDDGKTIATWYDDNSKEVWNVESGQRNSVVRGFGEWGLKKVLSPDGKTIATVSGSSVELRDADSGKVRGTLEYQKTSVTTASHSPDGRILVTGDNDGILYFWDAHTGQLKMALSSHDAGVNAIAVSSDGKTVASGTHDTLRLIDTESGKIKATLNGAGRVLTLAFFPKNTKLAVWGGTLRFWDLQNGQLQVVTEQKETARIPSRVLPTLRPPTAWTPTFSPDGRLLATGEWNKTHGAVGLWDVKRIGSGMRPIFLIPAEDVLALAFSPNGKTLATSNISSREVQLWDVATSQLNGTIGDASLEETTGKLVEFAFSSDGEKLATLSSSGKVLLWDATTGEQVPITPATDLADFPLAISRPISFEGASLSIFSSDQGRTIATMTPIPTTREASEARPIPATSRSMPRPQTDWCTTIPEGYFDCSANAARFIKWNVNGVLYPAERYMRRFHRPDLVRQALRGEKITEPEMTGGDIPPAAGFVGLKDGDPVPGDPMTVTIEATDDRDVKEVEILVNGRPLPPEAAKPITAPSRSILATSRPILAPSKPILAPSKVVDPNHRIAKRFTFRIPIPQGAEEIRLRAIAYDDTDLGSDPVEIVLKRAGVKPVAGNLYVVSVGVSRYRNGKDEGLETGDEGIRNLRFPSVDAKAIAERFRREGKPLYANVVVHELIDEQATVANLRKEFKWLKDSARPGQIDTVVLFLSGHGIGIDNNYYFATHETDLNNIPGTTLSGRELRQALGGQLTAKAVFLFVDTCHSGGLTGSNDHLAMEMGEGVYILASSGARQYSYESPEWGHGAFTLALLHALNKKELAQDGLIRFNALTYAVPDEVADLMTKASRNETEQAPVVPIASRQLRMPIAQVGRE